MTITEFDNAVGKLECEMIVAVLMASTYEYGYWKHYHARVYRVLTVFPFEIIFQNINDEKEWLVLNHKNMSSGQFKIEF